MHYQYKKETLYRTKNKENKYKYAPALYIWKDRQKGLLEGQIERQI